MTFAILHFYNFLLVIDTTVQNNDEISLHFNPLNSELNPICHLLALLEAHHILHVSRIRVKTMRLIFMNYSVKRPEVVLFTCDLMMAW
jgi:hypothetical protein